VIFFALSDHAFGPPEPNEAWKWAEHSARLDDMQGIPLVASRYLSGLPSERNVELGTNWLWRGVQKNQAPSMTFLADLLNEGTLIPQDRVAALALWKRSAQLGHAPAQANLAGQAFRTPPLISVAEGLRYLEMAAQQLWPPALAILSTFYNEGRYVTPDPVRARDYLIRAANANHAGAQCNLGGALFGGQYGETNASKAAELFKASAQQGYAPGQSAYGYVLSRGDGVPRDPVEAWKWCELAAAAGEKTAGTIMGILLQTLTPDQIEEARRRARTFQPLDMQQRAYLSVPRPARAAEGP
jgi:TPR repeat protein